MTRPITLTALLCALLVTACAKTPVTTPLEEPVAAPAAGACDADGFGCATARNLVLMVADPRDLDQAAPMGAPSGDHAVAAVRRHRAGQTRALSGETTAAETQP